MTFSAPGLPFLKGHGTQNDFVLVPDRDGSRVIEPELVRAICDRRAGIGADGLIRVAPGPDGRWFMDYSNADGSTAEMCGNGARVFARFLVDAGWQDAGVFDFTTRGGVRTAHVQADGDVGIDMGPVRLGATSTASLSGVEVTGISVDVGNPHLACVIDQDPAGLDLESPPVFDHELFPHGVNVEVLQVRSADEVVMRVYERGVGETRSCGTGTVAAAAAHLRAGDRVGGTVTVRVPGGAVVVELADGDGTGHPAARLTGPAVLVATGTWTG